MLNTSFIQKLLIRCPILQAPMAGGPAGPELAAAVSNAGGLGNLGAGYLSPQQLSQAIRDVRLRTDRPFGVNLFVPEPFAESAEEIRQMKDRLQAYRVQFGIASAPAPSSYAESFEEQVQAVLDEQVPVCSFTFGIPSQDVIQALKRQGTVVIGTATTVQEALQLEAAEVDVIVAQGSEAGGHRGSFLNDGAEPLIGTMALVPQIADQVSLPIIAAGGIMDGRGLAASLALGASAVQMGTAFLACPESGAHPVYKQRILSAREDDTEITTVYSGKAARGIITDFMKDMRDYSGTIPPYPIQNALTRDIRQAAAKAGDPEYMSLWAGQGLRLATGRTADDIVRQTMEQAAALMARMPSM
ncbi:nitronate monooxygenase [Paenibacillus sp. UNCCL117]|uniref:NAD(P)H-dependent flavin oxidoreductase n=1 Tax=unclassified Paenibacillus TaxID=185978 RepID=UPI000888B34D|nr:MULTISPECIES: DUF561 domain-containing protein [unclassified Paenibacillus]SDE49313.1 nitronate monooxygenase [Paenibacillus sp. cl123]SFW66858.1 nitronate monooxygenase [Paenibacillus sp. UNCCL117]